MYSRLGGDIKKGGLNCVTDMRLLVSMQKYNTHIHMENFKLSLKKKLSISPACSDTAHSWMRQYPAPSYQRRTTETHVSDTRWNPSCTFLLAVFQSSHFNPLLGTTY